MRNPNRLRTSRRTSACALARTERPLPPRMATPTHTRQAVVAVSMLLGHRARLHSTSNQTHVGV